MHKLVHILAAGLLAAGSAPGGDGVYAGVDLGTLGGRESRAWAINGRGDVCGEAQTASGEAHAFLWTADGGMIDLGTLGGRTSRAHDLNDARAVTGESDVTGGARRAFLWTAAAGLVALPAPTGTLDSAGHGINASGVVAGVVDTDDGARAAVWPGASGEPVFLTSAGHEGSAADVSDAGETVGQAGAGDHEDQLTRAFHAPPGGAAAPLAEPEPGLSSAALAVAGDGAVAGYAEIAAGVTHAFLFHPETGLRDIDTLNNVYSAAHGLNGRRQAVGVFFASPSEDDRPFLADAAGMRNLNDLLADANGWVLVEARGINDRGQIVGYGLHGGRERAFLLNPVAAPAGTDEPPAPRVRLVSPEPGARYEEPAAIPLQAEVEASGGVRRVVFRVNGARVGAVSNAPFALVWSNAPAAVCDLRAEAVDEQGRTGFSGRVRVVVGVAGSSPTNGAAPTAQAQPRPPGADAPDS